MIGVDFDSTFEFGRRNPPTIIWNITTSHPGRLGDWYNDDLKAFMKSDGVRITFSGYPKRRETDKEKRENDLKETTNNKDEGSDRDLKELVHAVVKIGAHGR